MEEFSKVLDKYITQDMRNSKVDEESLRFMHVLTVLLLDSYEAQKNMGLEKFVPLNSLRKDIERECPWLEYFDEQMAKSKRKAELDDMRVTVSSGKEFYANAESRGHMDSALGIAADFGQTETIWKLSDKMTPREQLVTIEELREARALALQEYARIMDIGGTV